MAPLSQGAIFVLFLFFYASNKLLNLFLSRSKKKRKPKKPVLISLLHKSKAPPWYWLSEMGTLMQTLVVKHRQNTLNF